MLGLRRTSESESAPTSPRAAVAIHKAAKGRAQSDAIDSQRQRDVTDLLEQAAVRHAAPVDDERSGKGIRHIHARHDTAPGLARGRANASRGADATAAQLPVLAQREPLTSVHNKVAAAMTPSPPPKVRRLPSPAPEVGAPRESLPNAPAATEGALPHHIHQAANVLVLHDDDVRATSGSGASRKDNHWASQSDAAASPPSSEPPTRSPLVASPQLDRQAATTAVVRRSLSPSPSASLNESVKTAPDLGQVNDGLYSELDDSLSLSLAASTDNRAEEQADVNIGVAEAHSDAGHDSHSLEAHSTEEARASGDAEGSVHSASGKSGTGTAHNSSGEMSPIFSGDEHQKATPYSRDGVQRAKPLGYVSFGSHPDVLSRRLPWLDVVIYHPFPYAHRSFRT